MPKQVYNIKAFHGGLNDGSDPRDIAENQLPEATNIAVDNIGRITPRGVFNDHTSINANTITITKGKGLFKFSHDRTGANVGRGDYSGTHTAADHSTIMTDSAATFPVDGLIGATINNTTDGSSGTITDNTATTVTATLTGGTDRSWDDASNDAYTITNFPETGDDYLAHVDGANSQIDIYSKANDSWLANRFSLGSASSPEPCMYAVDGALRVCDGKFTNTSTPKWFGYIKRTNFAGMNVAKALDGWYVEDQEIKAGTRGSCKVEENTGSYGNFSDPSRDAGIGNGAISLGVSANITDTGGMRGFKNYYYSLVYDGGQESQLFYLKGNNTNTGDLNVSDDVWENSKKKYQVYITPETFSGSTNEGLNHRCTGAKIYWKKADSSTVAYDDAYLLLICDWVKGVKSANSEGYVAWLNHGTSTVVTTTGGNTVANTGLEFTDEPRYQTYRTETGFSEDVTSISAKYKTAVVANRMTYIGNIKAETSVSGGNEIVMGDAMIKSPVNQFDSFPSSRTLEVTVKDGDEIIHLEEFADRLLQFKKNKLFIINISQDVEFLEDQLDHKGVNTSASVAKTDMGVVWANKHGCFLYDGQKVSNLLEKGGVKIISDSSWDAFLPSDHDPVVGYVPNKRQVIIADTSGEGDGSGDGTTYTYDFVTQSWVKSSGAAVIDADKSNFINDWDGTLIYGASNKIYEYRSQPYGQQISFRTKDIDFGQPSIRKKIYKVYVSYKGDASAVTCTYQTNGDTDGGSNFYKSGATGATTGGTASTTPFHSSTVGTDDWVKAELKPEVSINNINSFQLIFGGTVTADFEINDISIVYRTKGIK